MENRAWKILHYACQTFPSAVEKSLTDRADFPDIFKVHRGVRWMLFHGSACVSLLLSSLSSSYSLPNDFLLCVVSRDFISSEDPLDLPSVLYSYTQLIALLVANKELLKIREVDIDHALQMIGARKGWGESIRAAIRGALGR